MVTSHVRCAFIRGRHALMQSRHSKILGCVVRWGEEQGYFLNFSVRAF